MIHYTKKVTVLYVQILLENFLWLPRDNYAMFGNISFNLSQLLCLLRLQRFTKSGYQSLRIKPVVFTPYIENYFDS